MKIIFNRNPYATDDIIFMWIKEILWFSLNFSRLLGFVELNIAEFHTSAAVFILLKRNNLNLSMILANCSFIMQMVDLVVNSSFKTIYIPTSKYVGKTNSIQVTRN